MAPRGLPAPRARRRRRRRLAHMRALRQQRPRVRSGWWVLSAGPGGGALPPSLPARSCRTARWIPTVPGRRPRRGTLAASSRHAAPTCSASRTTVSAPGPGVKGRPSPAAACEERGGGVDRSAGSRGGERGASAPQRPLGLAEPPPGRCRAGQGLSRPQHRGPPAPWPWAHPSPS